MKLETLGKNILTVEVTHISSHGIWILAENDEMFLDYENFPWFKDASVKQILNVQEPSHNHFYGPNFIFGTCLPILQKKVFLS